MTTPFPTVVIGMHRSGTSALTACLNALGLAAPGGNEQIHASDNPVHLEPRRIVLHNDELLSARGGKWLYPGDLSTAPGPRWIKTAKNLMGEVFPTRGWVLKDPRMCLLLDAWSFLPSDTRFILVGRDPTDVAASLARRNGLTMTHGLALWDRYTADAEFSLQNKPVYVLTYELFTADPHHCLVELSEFLGLDDKPGFDARLTAAIDILDPNLGQRRAGADGSSLLADRWDHLLALTGRHDSLDSDPYPPSIWSTELLRVTRERDQARERRWDSWLQRVRRIKRRPGHAVLARTAVS